MTTEQTNQRTKSHVFFKNPELDFHLQAYALNYLTYGGAAEGEIFATATQIDEKKPQSWIEAWGDLSARVEARGDQCLSAGHPVSARDAYLRAFTYAHMAILCVRVTTPAFRTAWERMRAVFHKAAPLFDPPLEALAIPFDGQQMPAYFMRPAADPARRPTLIMIGGGDTYVEDLYFWGGAAALARGYNVLAIDLPGQGATPLDGMHYAPDTETAMRTVIDTVAGRKEVDPERIVAYGVSLGGYLVLRSAAFEKRIRACAASSPLVNLEDWILDAMPAPLRLTPGLWAGATSALGRFFSSYELIGFEKFFEWQMGCGNLKQALEKFHTMIVPVEQITCPVLCMLSEGEGKTFHTQTERCYQALKCSKKLVRFSAAEGAGAHCQAENLRLAHQVAFDWFDEILNAGGQP